MAKSTRTRAGSTRTFRRREELRRNLPRPTGSARALLKRPEVINAGVILLAYVAIASLLVVWSRSQVLTVIGQVMPDTRLNRVDYAVEDIPATEQHRKEARESAPRIYRLNDSYLERLAAALNGLPKAVEGKTSLNEISDELIAEYGLTEKGLAALQPYSVGGETTDQWVRWVSRLVHEELSRHPIMESKEYQNFTKTLHRAIARENGTIEPITGDAIEMTPGDSSSLFGKVDRLASSAGFPPSVAPFVQTRLVHEPKDTIIFDPVRTEQNAQVASEQVNPVFVEHRRNEIIYHRGDQLTPAQYSELVTENLMFHARASAKDLWLPRFGIIGFILILGLFMGSFVLGQYPRVLRNMVRVVAICSLMAGMLALTVTLAGQIPQLLYPAAVAPTLFVAIILLLSYDARLALMLSALQSALVALALGQGVAWFLLLMTGCGIMIAQLPEVRNRNSLIRAATVTAAGLGAGIILIGLFRYPPVEGLLPLLLSQAAWTIAAALAVGFLVLGILPSIERGFDIITGMTLAELRDPSQPLLRQLQQRAPGTYNHSLQVATIAEAAADAIHADSLLVYVGALYHDIGKMNKPEYFVENQAGGFNKHNKLRPAMSLLVIIGHVKDGIELAREYNLPRALQHFIEAHHGTTLVEYFYHAAKSQAERDERSVDEIEFRYPGPKPQTKEAAILMLSDAVESATRAMPEPNPSRIETLVRELSRKRLLDGQFDECDLTFRELGLIEDAVIARLCAIHHGRISYPSTTGLTGTKAEPPTESAVSA